jgi:hypothetical protein
MHACGPGYFRRNNRLHGDRTKEIVARPIREKAENPLSGRLLNLRFAIELPVNSEFGAKR